MHPRQRQLYQCLWAIMLAWALGGAVPCATAADGKKRTVVKERDRDGQAAVVQKGVALHLAYGASGGGSKQFHRYASHYLDDGDAGRLTGATVGMHVDFGRRWRGGPQVAMSYVTASAASNGIELGETLVAFEFGGRVALIVGAFRFYMENGLNMRLSHDAKIKTGAGEVPMHTTPDTGSSELEHWLGAEWRALPELAAVLSVGTYGNSGTSLRLGATYAL